MQFIVIAHDGTDAQALSRRMKAREAHLALGDEMIASGKLLHAAALLNEKEEMCGSVMTVAFNDRTALDEWLAAEPYVTGKVWQKIEVLPCRVGPGFVQKR